jgi:hypothetical protein
MNNKRKMKKTKKKVVLVCVKRNGCTGRYVGDKSGTS